MDLPSACIEASQHPGIVAAVEQIADDDWSLHVAALARVGPNDGSVRLINGCRRNIALGVGTYCTHRPILSVGAGQENKPMGNDGGGNRNISATVQSPAFLTAIEIVAS